MEKGNEMFLKKAEGPRAVKLPDGRIMCMSDLPSENTRRWVASRKEKVVLAVEYGLMKRITALERYSLSDEEFTGWCNVLGKHGAGGLMATKLNQYRQP